MFKCTDKFKSRSSNFHLFKLENTVLQRVTLKSRLSFDNRDFCVTYFDLILSFNKHYLYVLEKDII